jgi:hypothetical protein
MHDSRESKTKELYAMPVETWWCKSPCLMQLLGGVRLNADADVALFCCRDSCSTSMLDCNRCGIILSCETCNNVEQCSKRRLSSCKTCDTVYSCDDCAKLFCKACLYSSTCDECSKVLSEKCVHDGKERLIKYCEGCWSDVCGGRMPRSRECLCHML